MKLGFDIGSTTIKCIVIDKNDRIIYKNYQRHYSHIRETFKNMVKDVYEELGNIPFSACMTGSGALSFSENLKVNFVQEVIATAKTVEKYIPQTDVAIELGGEDAKIIYFSGQLEQRMNGICAGGTGAFIDQMAGLLECDAQGLNHYAKHHSLIYPIASRCGVFAKSDIQPLINEGAKKEDLAASIFQAIVNQTISGLACGKPIRGRVAFLGGPLFYLSELRARFIENLKLTDDEIIFPSDSNLYAAIGAALSANDEKQMNLKDFYEKTMTDASPVFEMQTLPALFASKEEHDAFKKRHGLPVVTYADVTQYEGNAYLGIDAGSTTTKVVLLGEKLEILYEFYQSNAAKPVETCKEALLEIYRKKHQNCNIRKTCVTGYGEALLKAAFCLDIGEIETVAHYKAARFFNPNVDFILDIGGQDMKCMKVKNGVIDDVLLNEACSAGCGSFIESFAKSLGYSAAEFSTLAQHGKRPIDLGSRCTVFMNSSVKQAQKEGVAVEDIAAGLCYSVIYNALYKVIKMADPSDMGACIVVQGGTFYNDGILRAFENITKKQVTRSPISGLMGAFGAALIAQEMFLDNQETSFMQESDIANLACETTHKRCKICSNQCLLTLSHFTNGMTFTSGNRCEKGAGKELAQNLPFNMFAYKLKKLFGYKQLPVEQAKRGRVGIPRVLNMFENYPFWYRFFTTLSYSVQLSPFSSKKIYEMGIESIPSESACYPAKLVHGHIEYLLSKGVSFIFYPSVMYEQKEFIDADHHFNCPIVTSYPENIKNNLEGVRAIDFRSPFLNFSDKEFLKQSLSDCFSEIPLAEIHFAVELAWEELQLFQKDIRQKGKEIVEDCRKSNQKAIVLAGRPYHLDPEIHHGIPDMICAYGYVVLTEDSVSHLSSLMRPLKVRDQWAYHSRLYQAAAFVCEEKNVDLIQLNSFGCGLDAVTTDEVSDICKDCNKIYTCIKIDEVNNLGAARIRVRSLFSAQKDREKANVLPKPQQSKAPRVEFTKKMKKNYTILMPQMSPMHFDLIKEAFIASSYHLEMLPAQDKECVHLGLKYVNNDACYPALIVVGQMMKALESKRYDLDQTAILISQTGGGCRASNYIGFIRKALIKAKLEHIPVISVSPMGIEKNSGFSLTFPILIKALQAVIYGDILMKVLLETRPFEIEKGAADHLYKTWNEKCKASVRSGHYGTFKRNIKQIVSEFDQLPCDFSKPKPKVGVVGEILVKYHPTANNDIVSVLEKEGVVAVVPGLLGFVYYCAYNSVIRSDQLSGNKKSKWLSQLLISCIEKFEQPAKEALAMSERFTADKTIKELADMAKNIVSLLNQTGEGWFLTAEMIELIEEACPNIICTQPFACLPNHVTGKGVIKELKRQYPQSNVVAIDYDPGASEVNQLNRIRLMLAGAFKNLHQNAVLKTPKIQKQILQQTVVLKR